MNGVRSILGLENIEQLQNQLDELRKQQQAATHDYEVCEATTRMREKYGDLFAAFKRDVLGLRRDRVAHLAIGQRDQSQRDKLEGRYAELTDLMQTDFQDKTDLHNAMIARHKIAGEIIEVEGRINKARLREQQKAMA